MSIEFQGWPKIPRLFRDMLITEKIDGTNAAVIFATEDDVDHAIIPGTYYSDQKGFGFRNSEGTPLIVGAQSRKRLITPLEDNFGFARWVLDHMVPLADVLGPGRHFGEWWGSGIQRGYGLQKGEKRFSLFNLKRYGDLDWDEDTVPGMGLVPKLYEGPFNTDMVDDILDGLALRGSAAAPGFHDPEGIIVFHGAANSVFKVTVKDDEKPKGVAA